MAGRDLYAKGYSDDFSVNDNVDKPLSTPLTPEYVREITDDRHCEAALLDRAERMVKRGEMLPDWLSREIIRMGRMGRAPRTVWQARKDIWRRGIDILKTRFGLTENAATKLVASDGAIETSFEAVKKTIQRLKPGK